MKSYEKSVKSLEIRTLFLGVGDPLGYAQYYAYQKICRLKILTVLLDYNYIPLYNIIACDYIHTESIFEVVRLASILFLRIYIPS